MIFWPYKMGSSGCQLLARSLGVRRVYSEGRYNPKSSDIVINWGNTRDPVWNIAAPKLMLNMPRAVALASNKLECFRKLQARGVPTVEFTTQRELAQNWSDDGHAVFCRHQLSGHGGAGITVCIELDEVPEAPLYTKGLLDGYVEYRAHIFRDRVIHLSQKKRMSADTRDSRGIILNRYIRNHANGWVFSIEPIQNRDCHILSLAAKSAVAALGLDFGAVDMLLCRDLEDVKVLEVNTAPGLSGVTTLAAYKNALERYNED